MRQPDDSQYLRGNGKARFGAVALLTLCLLIVFISVIFFVSSIFKPYMGVELGKDSQGWRVAIVEPQGTGSQAGINVGDRPVEINGQPAETFLKRYENAGLVLGILEEIAVTDARGQVKSATVRDSPPSVQAIASVATWFTVSLVFWLVGFYVFLKRPSSIIGLILCLAAAVFGLALSATAAALRAIPMASNLAIAASIFGPWLLLHFFLILPEDRIRTRDSWITYLFYLTPTVTLVLLLLVGYSNGQPVLWFRNIRYLEAGAVLLVTAGVAVFNFVGAASPRTRQQMKMIMVGCVAALLPFLLVYVLPQLVWGEPIVPSSVSILFFAFIPLSMGYAVLTQKLLDIDVIIRRGVIYGLITAAMTILLAAAIFFTSSFRQAIGPPEQAVIALLLGGAATALFGPLKRGAEAIVDRLFYKDRHDYKKVVQSLSAALKSVNDVTEISRLVVGATVGALNLAGGALLVRTQRSSLDVGATQGAFSDPAKRAQLLTALFQRNRLAEFPNQAGNIIMADLAFLIPLAAGEKEIGFICLSHKVSRQAFSADDLFLLQGIASLAAMALQSAMLVRDVSVRDTFVSIASHELRTPLTAIMGYTDLLLRRDPPEATRKQWLTYISDNSRKVSAMVDDLLNVSRIQSGRISIKLDNVELCDILKEALNLTGDGPQRHEFVLDISPDLPDVRLDRDKFGQVVGNLLSNAIKYSPGGGRVTLSARNDKERHRVVVSVSDEGIGIGPEDRDRLFTTFHRIQRPETQGIRGSGLGLYIAKEWTEAMGGEIWLESEMNKGSTFFIGIPTGGEPGRL